MISIFLSDGFVMIGNRKGTARLSGRDYIYWHWPGKLKQALISAVTDVFALQRPGIVTARV